MCIHSDTIHTIKVLSIFITSKHVLVFFVAFVSWEDLIQDPRSKILSDLIWSKILTKIWSFNSGSMLTFWDPNSKLVSRSSKPDSAHCANTSLKHSRPLLRPLLSPDYCSYGALCLKKPILLPPLCPLPSSCFHNICLSISCMLITSSPPEIDRLLHSSLQYHLFHWIMIILCAC